MGCVYVSTKVGYVSTSCILPVKLKNKYKFSQNWSNGLENSFILSADLFPPLYISEIDLMQK